MLRRSLVALMAALPLTAVIARRASADARPCSCHPSEAFRPCPGMHAWRDCAVASMRCPECGGRDLKWCLSRDALVCDTCGAWAITAMELVERGDFRRYSGYEILELPDRRV